MKPGSVRTRIAPSPTGDLHIGGVRTAMFAWLIARQNNGQFVLRIEDTDKKREQEGSTQRIIDTLDFLGIDRDEGPQSGGSFGPYVQSQRTDIYKTWADKLIAKGLAYIDTTTPDEVQKWRQQAKDAKQPFLFRNFTQERQNVPNDDSWYGKYPLRFRIDNPGRVDWHDEVRGDLTAGTDSLDDFIIMKADKLPTYNFAHIVDDCEMQISHVVRADEFISSMPKFIRLYQALGVDLPKFVTLPPILGASGNKKLSKRDGAKGAIDYGRDGYPVDAIWNFLCQIGWNDGTTDEIFSRSELIKAFSIDRIQKSGGRFDIQRLDWVSGHHIRRQETADLMKSIAWQEDALGVHFWPQAAYEKSGSGKIDGEYDQQVLALCQEKLKKYSDLAEDADLFYGWQNGDKSNAQLRPEVMASHELLTKLFPAETAGKILSETRELLAREGTFKDTQSIEKALRGYASVNDLHTGKYFRLVRAAVTGGEVAPGLFETIQLLGRDDVLARLDASVQTVQKES